MVTTTIRRHRKMARQLELRKRTNDPRAFQLLKSTMASTTKPNSTDAPPKSAGKTATVTSIPIIEEGEFEDEEENSVGNEHPEPLKGYESNSSRAAEDGERSSVDPLFFRLDD